MAAIFRRLASLERRAQEIVAATPTCLDCGQSLRPRWGVEPVTVSIRFADAEEAGLGSEHCPTCGALKVARIQFDDAG